MYRVAAFTAHYFPQFVSGTMHRVCHRRNLNLKDVYCHKGDADLSVVGT